MMFLRSLFKKRDLLPLFVIFIILSVSLSITNTVKESTLIKITVIALVSPALLLYFAGCRINKKILRIPAFVIFALMLLVYLAALAFSPVRQALLSEYVRLIVFFTVMLLPALLYTRGRFYGLLLGSVFFAGILSLLYGFMQLGGLDFANWGVSRITRIFSSYGNPNFYAGFLIAALPFFLALFMLAKRFIWRYLLGIATALLMVSLLLTFTRSSWIGGLCGILFFLYLAFGGKNKRLYKSLRIIIRTFRCIPSPPSCSLPPPSPSRPIGDTPECST